MFPVTIIMLLGGALLVSTVANVVLGWMALRRPAAEVAQVATENDSVEL